MTTLAETVKAAIEEYIEAAFQCYQEAGRAGNRLVGDLAAAVDEFGRAAVEEQVRIAYARDWEGKSHEQAFIDAADLMSQVMEQASTTDEE